MFTHLKVIWVAAQSQCLLEGFHVTEFQENLLKFKIYIFTDSTSVSYIDSQQNKNILLNFILFSFNFLKSQV